MTPILRSEALAKEQEKKRAYQLVFGSPAGQAVLADLAPFCRSRTTCFHADPRIHAAHEGRREVWLRIHDYIERTPDELVQLHHVALTKENDQ